MKALTLYPWWALSIRDHGKLTENREWTPVQYIGERIAIHAGVRVPTRDDLWSWLQTVDECPFNGRRIGKRYAYEWDVHKPGDPAKLRAIIAEVAGRVICTARLVGVDRDMREGQWHWRLADVERVEGQPPIKGRLGLWEWTPAEVEVSRG